MRFGMPFGAAIAIGVLCSESLLPLSPPASRATAGLAVAATMARASAWPLVPWALALHGTALSRERHARYRVDAPLRLEGRHEVLRPEGGGVVIRCGRRELLVSEPAGLPPPGFAFTALVRADPIVSSAEPSAFRADRWAERRRLDGRGKVLGAVTPAGPAEGVLAACRRAAHACRQRTWARFGGPGEDSGALLGALLLGDRSGLEVADRDAFRRAGLAHVLALSGMHTAILAMGLVAVLRAALVPAWPRTVLVLAFLAAFAFLAGAPPSILRACGSSTIALVGSALGRRASPLDALGWVGGTMILLDPPVLDDVGFRLSFAATALLVLFARRPARPRRGPLHTLLAALALSSIITLGTLPDIAGSFGCASFLSPLTNLFAGPPSTAALGWGALAVVPLPFDAGERLAAAAHLASEALLVLVRRTSGLPGGEVPLPACGLALGTLLCGAATAWAAGRRPSGALQRAAATLLVLAVLGRIPRERLSVLDVGQGNAVLVESARGAALVDAGLPGWSGDSAAFRAARYRGRSGLRAAVVTHAHADHAGGLADFFRRRGVEELWVPPRRGEAPSPLAELVADAPRSEVRLVVPGLAPLEALPGRLRVVSPRTEAELPEDADENERSLVARWSAGRAAALLTGDLGVEGEAALLAAQPAAFLRAPVLLAGHHGSRGSTGEPLLDAVRPRLVLVSCGTGNSYGHPHAETLERVRRSGAALLRTDRDGTIMLTATARGFRIRWVRGFPGPRALFPAIPLPGPAGFP